MTRARTVPPPPDDAFLEVDGRRWRRSDPHIPPALRQQLVTELMSARRAVRDATDLLARRQARARVQDAKVALGERGRAWWLDASPTVLEPRIDAAIRALLRGRHDGATICPSEPARVVDGQAWRRLLPLVRARAVHLARAGWLAIVRGGAPAVGDLTAGVLRYRLATGTPEDTPRESNAPVSVARARRSRRSGRLPAGDRSP